MSVHRAWFVATILSLLPGCALFVADGKTTRSPAPLFPWFKGKDVAETDNALVLKMARLEASIISRPVNDAKIRRYVWEELDESGPMAPDVRQKLNDCGFRIGVAGSTTPWALQSLAREAVLARRSDNEQNLMDSGMQTSVGPSFSLMVNGRSLLEVQSQLDGSMLPLNQIPELTAVRDRTGLRCVMEVSVRELTEDWVLLNVIPQIHTGSATTRLSVSGTSEQLPVRQNIIPFYDQQFTVKLLAGEIAVIGRQESAQYNLGKLFFQPDSGSSGSEKLLIIRMAGIDRLKGKSDTSFRLDTYDK